MKKSILTLLVLTLLFSFSAFAEETKLEEEIQKFDFTFVLPQGATIEQEVVDGELSLAYITLSDENAPDYCLSIAFDEMLASLSFEEMTEEDLKLFEARMTLDCDQPTVQFKTLEDGRKICIIDEDSTSDFAYVISLVDGYQISCYISHDDFSDLTENDIEKAIEIMDSIKITNVASAS